MNWKAQVACNFKCLFKNETLLNSHADSYTGSISKMAQDGVVITTDY